MKDEVTRERKNQIERKKKKMRMETKKVKQREERLPSQPEG